MKPLVVVVRDLVFRSKIHAAAERQGVPLRLAPRGSTLAEALAGIERPTVLADLSEPGLLEQVRAAKAAGPVRVIGFLGHLQEGLMAEARAAGVDEVLTRGQFVVRLDSLLHGGELH
jgi:CheY-like chemotaxis protein